MRTFRIRLLVQGAFALVSLLLGAQFARFVAAAEAGASELPARPPGVEAYLPISGLMGVLDWLYQGTLNVVHPAATLLFLTFVAMALVLRKSFCSWVCPVGLLSECTAWLGRRILGRNLRVPRWLDWILRSPKYLLLAFFMQAILAMSPAALQGFIASPYNRVADVKMYLFFVELGQIGATVIGVLLLLSLLVQGAWCRYLCPYGALLGLVSWASPVKVRRDTEICTACGLCDKACMAQLPVSKKLSITTPECTGCLDCVASCPHAGALRVGTKRRTLRPLAFAGVLVALFFAAYVGARATGSWSNAISDAEYARRVQELHLPSYGHPR